MDEIAHSSIEQFGADRTGQYMQAIDKQIDVLANHPELGRARPEIAETYRSLPCGSHVIFYRSEGGRVDIEGVIHKSRDMSPDSPLVERLRSAAAQLQEQDQPAPERDDGPDIGD